MGRGDGVHAGGVEGESFDFGFGALRFDFLIVPEERDSGGVADFDGNFAGGANGRVGGGDQRFLRVRLAVGDHGDPSRFVGADDQRHGSGGIRRRSRRRIEGANGDIIFYDDFFAGIISRFLSGVRGRSCGCVRGRFRRWRRFRIECGGRLVDGCVDRRGAGCRLTCVDESWDGRCGGGLWLSAGGLRMGGA